MSDIIPYSANDIVLKPFSQDLEWMLQEEQQIQRVIRSTKKHWLTRREKHISKWIHPVSRTHYAETPDLSVKYQWINEREPPEGWTLAGTHPIDCQDELSVKINEGLLFKGMRSYSQEEITFRHVTYWDGFNPSFVTGSALMHNPGEFKKLCDKEIDGDSSEELLGIHAWTLQGEAQKLNYKIAEHYIEFLYNNRNSLTKNLPEKDAKALNDYLGVLHAGIENRKNGIPPQKSGESLDTSGLLMHKGDWYNFEDSITRNVMVKEMSRMRKQARENN